MTRFKVEFAAMSHHDNCKGGLLAHTYKVLLLMKFVCRQYEAATTKRGTDYTDLLYILIEVLSPASPTSWDSNVNEASNSSTRCTMWADTVLHGINMVLFENQPLMTRFKVEFAAMSHHDNCSGLIQSCTAYQSLHDAEAGYWSTHNTSLPHTA